jgi:hypothetical protein
MPQVFPSKIDWALAVAPVLGVAGAAVAFVVAGDRLPAAIQSMILLTVFPTVAIVVWMMAATYYRLDDQNLTVRCGPFRWRIALTEISAVSATRDPSSGPALSLDRLRVEYGGGRAILISPRDASGFLDDLERLRGGAPAGPCGTARPCGPAGRQS